MKRFTKTIILLLVLCLTAGGYMLLQRSGQETASVNQSEGSFEITAHAVDDLRSLSYTKNETAYQFTTLGEGEWQVSGQLVFPLNSSAVQNMAESLIGMTATRKLTDVTALADYGLEEPAFSATVTWQDNSETIYAMGDATPFADGYYLYLMEDPSTVYTVSQALTSILSKDLMALTVTEEIPQADSVTRIVIGNTLDAIRKNESITIDPDQYWYDASENPLNSTEMEELIEIANGLTFSSVADATPDEEKLQEFQLTEAQATRIVLFNGETAERTVLVGTIDENGDYYAKLPDSSIIYTMDSSDVYSLLNASAESLAVTEPVPLAYENLASAEFSANGINWMLQPSCSKEAEMDADEEADEGQNADPGESVWEQVRGLNYSELSEPKEGEVLLTIHLSSVNGMTETLTISAFDADHYQSQADEQKPMLVSADQVDKLIRTLKSIQ